MNGASGAKTLVELLTWRADYQPDQRLYTFLIDGENEASYLTNQELGRKARSIAAWLQQLGLAGERALLLYPPGLDYITAFFGCLCAGVVAVPAYPPRLNRPMPRLQAIVKDAQAKVALTTTSILSKIERRFEHTPNLKALQWLVVDDVPPGIEANWQEPALTTDTLAFLQYTSGSTSTPRGVMLSHANLMHNMSLIGQRLNINAGSVGVFWLPPYHDMGLIGGILEPLHVGRPATLIAPIAFLQHPVRWLQAITRYGATISGAPNFAYELCIQKISPQQQETLDLSSWEVAFCGAEPIRWATLDRFASVFAPFGFRCEAFYPCYGLAEATVFVSGGLKNERPIRQAVKRDALEKNRVVRATDETSDAHTLVSCGRQLPDHKIVIANPDTLTRSLPDEVGEVWVAGPSVAQGYWNRPGETANTFQAYLADTGEGPFLRTGDMGFLQGEELFITGRLKDMLIIRGRNHYPQDIELTVEQAHPALRPNGGAAFSVEDNHQERLVIVQEVKRESLRRLDPEDIVTAIRQAVAEQHEIQLYAVTLLKTGTIPKTSSGKIQRHASRAGFLAGKLETVAEWSQEMVPKTVSDRGQAQGIGSAKELSPTPKKIQDWFVTEISRRLKIDPDQIDVREPLTRYGLDSIEAVNIACELEIWLDRELDPTLLYNFPTIESLVRHLTAVGSEGAPDVPSEPAPRQIIDGEIPAEYYRFDLYPPYLELRQRLEVAATVGIQNPYFKVHERVTNDTTVIEGREYINYSSYNYLGMSGDPAVTQATKAAIDRYGTSVSASRVASGEKPLHRELERALAGLIGVEDCIVYVGGHATNVTTIGHLLGPNDLILHDALIHNSVAQGCQLSGARRVPFPHNDLPALDHLLTGLRHRYQRVLIVIEGVYSMDGDIPDLPHLIQLKKRHKTFLMIDEAHSIGVLGPHGRGIAEYFGIDANEVDIWMGTLSKSFASCGGYIAGDRALVEYLKYTAPGFVYSVGMSPANGAAALAAIRVLAAEPERVARLHKRAELFLTLARKHRLDTGNSHNSPVIPVIVGDSFLCMQLAQALFGRGINVQPMIYPAVENNAARLRFFITCTHTEEQIRYTVETVAEELARLRSESE